LPENAKNAKESKLDCISRTGNLDFLAILAIFIEAQAVAT
jgi:hypothetical protein